MLSNIISLQIKDRIWKAVWRDLWEQGQWICDDSFFQKYPKYLADLSRWAEYIVGVFGVFPADLLKTGSDKIIY